MKEMDRVMVYGADWCPDCRRTKDFLEKHKIDFDYVKVDMSAVASALVEKINNGKRIIPTLIIEERAYTNPQNHQLAEIFGINRAGKVVLYGADWCPDCRRAKRFLQDNQLNYQFVDVDKYEDAARLVERLNKGKRIIPTLFVNDEVFSNPSNQHLTDVLGLDKISDERIYDVIIIGGGAAGLTTAIYAQRDKFDTLILERKNIGGNAFITNKIENYPGFKEVSGPELMDRMADQAMVLGSKVETGVEVTDIEKLETHFNVYSTGGTFRGKAIVIAAGSQYRTLNVQGESELIGSGIHFCATCDGAFYRDREVIVIGGGNSALEEGMFLAGFCKKVSIVHRSPAFSATETYKEKLASFKNIETYMDYQVQAFVANDQGLFHHALLKHNQSGVEVELKADGVFVFIGLSPNTQVYRSLINLSESGHILTKGLNQTSLEGIFAAGDCRKGAIAQVAAATGEGVVASYGVRDYLKS